MSRENLRPTPCTVGPDPAYLPVNLAPPARDCPEGDPPMKLLRLAAIPAVALIAVAAAALPAQANHSWGGYHWARAGGAATPPLVSSLTSDWTGNLATANGDWNKSAYVESAVVS